MLIYFIIGLIVGAIYFVDEYQKANRYRPWINRKLNETSKPRTIRLVVKSVAFGVFWFFVVTIMIGAAIKSAYTASKTN